MERKRIIIEADGGSDIDERLSKIEDSLTDLQDKTSNKWVLPVLLLVITSFMTAANFFISRHYNNEDVYGNKLKEKIAELRATETISFFRKSLNILDTLNGAFHSICEFDVENKTDKQIDTAIMRMNNLIDQQLTIDTTVVNAMAIYKRFVNVSEFNISTGHVQKKDRMLIYEKSNVLYVKSVQSINKSLNAMTAP